MSDDNKPKVGSVEWQHEKTFGSDEDDEFDQEMDRIERWFWRTFYTALALIVVSFLAMIAGVVLIGMNFGEIVEFLRGFQGVIGL